LSHDLSWSELQIDRANTKNSSMRVILHHNDWTSRDLVRWKHGDISTNILTPVSIHQTFDWHVENTLGKLPYLKPPLGSSIVMLADFCPCWFFLPLWFLHFLAKCPFSLQTRHMFIVFFSN
jgi:hypothetical protein